MCFPEEVSCINGADDDCNGLVDCEDPGCSGDPSCCVPQPEDCSNGRDDDCDFATDCRDADCRFSPFCASDMGPPDMGPGDMGPPPTDMPPTPGEIGVAMCTNGADDDGDGRVDCADTDCSPFGPSGECCDGVDDDGDGFTDVFTCRCFSDADCAGVGDIDQVCYESTFSVCAPRCDFFGGDSFCQMIDPSLRCVRRGPRAGECVP